MADLKIGDEQSTDQVDTPETENKVAEDSKALHSTFVDLPNGKSHKVQFSPDTTIKQFTSALYDSFSIDQYGWMLNGLTVNGDVIGPFEDEWLLSDSIQRFAILRFRLDPEIVCA